MRHPIRVLSTLLAVAVTMCASAASAQAELTANVPFAFKVGNTTHQAGQYTLRTDEEMMRVEIAPLKGAPTAALVETRLAAPEPLTAEPRLVFDKVGDVYYLAELWTPGQEGFLLHVTKAKHTHVAVKLGKTS
jgi:hypothetical protein